MNKRIAVAIEEHPGNKELVAEHFGRCSKIVVVEVNSQNEIIKNEVYSNPLADSGHGTCQLPGYINQFSVSAVIAGGMGGKAVANFEAFGIEVVTAPGMIAKDAVQLFTEGKLTGYEACAGHEGEHNC